MKNKIIGSVLLASCGLHAGGFQQKPNVVLIVCDDLNDYITGISGQAGHPQVVRPDIHR